MIFIAILTCHNPSPIMLTKQNFIFFLMQIITTHIQIFKERNNYFLGQSVAILATHLKHTSGRQP